MDREILQERHAIARACAHTCPKSFRSMINRTPKSNIYLTTCFYYILACV